MSSHFVLANPDPLLRKIHQGIRFQSSIKIDGDLSEIVWQTAPISSGFTQFEPSPGIPASQKSEVRVIYDNKAIYIGALLRDEQPDQILRQLS